MIDAVLGPVDEDGGEADGIQGENGENRVRDGQLGGEEFRLAPRSRGNETH